MSDSGKIRIILALHAHLPYVKIPDKKFPLQELWLYQAMTESYIPLILCFRELIDNKTDFNITLSVSPTLLSMLSGEYYKSKYQDYLRTILKIARRKSSDSSYDEKRSFIELLNKVQTISNFYIEIKGDIINELKKLSLGGRINLITTSASHAVLPLYRFSDNLIRSQIGIGQRVFENAFGFVPKGFWLPEMGYYANLDNTLRDYNIQYTFLDAHCVYLTPHRPSYGNFYPSITKSGLLIFPRDLPLSNTIWSAKTGYPGDYRYKEFHFDYTYSLSDSELNEYEIDRIPFGLKIYRITGGEKAKEFYDFKKAMEAVDMHSDDFIDKIIERALLIKQHVKKTPVFTLAFDAELFGHWWYEGPEFLKKVITKISSSNKIKLISPEEIKDERLETVVPAECSWGRGGFFNSWINPECTWIYPELASLDVRMNNAGKYANQKARILAMKEILLASASDWTFFISNNTSGDYAKMRLYEHINSAKKIMDEIESGETDEKFLSDRDALYPVFVPAHN